MPEVLMPRLSDTMEDGTIVAWLVADGAQVTAGDEIVEIESDKATMAYPAEASGVLRIATVSGTSVAPGTQIARIETDGAGAVPVTVPDPTADAASGATAGTSANGADAQPNGSKDGGDAQPNGSKDEADIEADAGGPGGASTAGGSDRGITDGTAILGEVSDPARSAPADGGSSGGATATPDDATAVSSSPVPASSSGAAAVHFREPSRIERLVTKRMVQSRSEIPDFAVTVEIDMSAALALRADLKLVGGRRVPSVNDLIVKACAMTLVEHPRVNSAWIDDRIAAYTQVNVGVAVATDEGQLVVPVIRDADGLTLGALAAQSRDLTKRARAGRITPSDLSGGTFTVSNLGMLGVAHFSAIITPGQGAILAVGSTATKFVAVDGAPVARPILTATLCSDHRVIYGAHAAAFLDRLRTYLEHPGSLAL